MRYQHWIHDVTQHAHSICIAFAFALHLLLLIELMERDQTTHDLAREDSAKGRSTQLEAR
jgi:hypothetical protein